MLDFVVIAVARRLLDSGYLVHPVYGVEPSGLCACRKPESHPNGRGIGKHPLNLRWSRRVPTIHDFLAGIAPLNIALECGPQPNGVNLFGVDYDGDVSVGLVSPVHSVTRRGTHHYFRVDSGDSRARTAQDVTGTRASAKARGDSPYLAGGVDLKYTGGALLIQPSRRSDGILYSTTLDLLLDRKIPQLPPRGATPFWLSR